MPCYPLRCISAPQQDNAAMELDLVMGRYLRLRQELSSAYQAPSWDSERIDALADQIAATEREIAAAQSVGEHFGEAEFGVVQ
jgi:cell division FtsZ-interacting protein ZapD